MFATNILKTLDATLKIANVTQVAMIISYIIATVLPLIIVAYGGMVSEHSGIINLALEGIMVFGAMAGFLVLRSFSSVDGKVNLEICNINPILAVFIASLVAGLVGVVASLLLAFASINLKANQTLIGTAINVLALAFAIAIVHKLTGTNGELGIDTRIDAPDWLRITQKNFGSETQYYNIVQFENPTFWQYVGYFFSVAFFSNLYLTNFIIVILIVLTAVFLKKTKVGLRLVACGENPQACDSVGISVTKIRYLGTCISGFLGGIGGFAFVSMLNLFDANSGVLGFGFLALAVMIFGNWKPGVIIGTAFIFATFRVLAYNPWIQDMMFPNSQFAGLNDAFQMVPYVVTIIILILSSKRNNCPKAEGIPYEKGAR